ncbi:MAG: hypothetical protein QOJ99_402 [Bryobacterales bacterium]|jgi:hypothetical protein|nr:hypothetical protein [Bryobacterales bacterium]
MTYSAEIRRLKCAPILLAMTLTIFGDSRLFGGLISFQGATVAACVAIVSSPASCLAEGYASDNLSASLNQTFAQAGFNLSANGSAKSGFGVLRASASSTYSSSGPYSYLSSQAFFQDVVTIDFSPFQGSTGLLVINFALDGFINASGPGIGSAAVGACAGPTQPPGNCQGDDFTASASGTFGFPQPFTFTYGQPFALQVSLRADNLYGYLSGFSGSGSAMADFSDTLILSGLHVFDAQMNPVTEVTFRSASGTGYTQNGVVPEASSFVLCTLGFTLFGPIILRRAKTARPLQDPRNV